MLRHFPLLRLLVLRDLRLRTSGTFLGRAWLFLQPALQIFTFWFLLDYILRIRTTYVTVPYLHYFLLGMIPWLAMSDLLARSASVLHEFAPFFQRTPFPIWILPLTIWMSSLLIYAPVYGLLAAFLVSPLAGIKAFLLLITLSTFLIPLMYLLAIFGVFIRDVRQAIGVLLTLVMYLTPILYTPTALPESVRWLLVLNPFADIIAIFQGVLQGLALQPGNFLRPLGLSILGIWPAWWLYRRALPQIREFL